MILDDPPKHRGAAPTRVAPQQSRRPPRVSSVGPFYLYRFWGVRCQPGWFYRLLNRATRGLFATDVLLYLGQTGRVPIRRLGEHFEDKQWAGDVRAWEVDDRTYATEAEVLAAEKAAIRAEHPLHNIVHNEGRGRPANTRGPRWQARRRLRNRLLGLAVLWVGLVAGLGWMAGQLPVLPDAGVVLWLRVVVATLVTVWVGWPGRGNRRRR